MIRNDFHAFETYLFKEHHSPTGAESSGDAIYLPPHAAGGIATLGGLRDVKVSKEVSERAGGEREYGVGERVYTLTLTLQHYNIITHTHT